MPKQLIRGNAARNAVVQVKFDQVHCRDLDQLLQQASDKTRLRGDRRQGELDLKTLPHADTVIRRLFNRDQIVAERLAVRAALARAAHNVTPERLRTLGSPGRLAVLDLRHAASLGLDRDIRVGQVRNAAAMLARDRKKRSVMSSPVKTRSAWLAKKGTNTLTSAEGARRVQLRAFCMDDAARSRLAALLADSQDKPAEIAASISMFKAEAITFAIEDMLGGKRDPRSPTGQSGQSGKSADSPLLRLFIQSWCRARQAGRIGSRTFPWFDAVDWLVNKLNGARPTSPGATRAPKSPRVISPAAALRRAQSAAPTSPPRQPPAPAKHTVVRRLTTASSATPQQAQPRYGRQSASIRMQTQLQSPTRLADKPASPIAAISVAAHTGTVPSPHPQPVAQPVVTHDPVLPVPATEPEPAEVAPISQASPLGPTASLLDLLLEYFASQHPEAPDGEGGTGQVPGSPGNANHS